MAFEGMDSTAELLWATDASGGRGRRERVEQMGSDGTVVAGGADNQQKGGGNGGGKI